MYRRRSRRSGLLSSPTEPTVSSHSCHKATSLRKNKLDAGSVARKRLLLRHFTTITDIRMRRGRHLYRVQRKRTDDTLRNGSRRKSTRRTHYFDSQAASILRRRQHTAFTVEERSRVPVCVERKSRGNSNFRCETKISSPSLASFVSTSLLIDPGLLRGLSKVE